MELKIRILSGRSAGHEIEIAQPQFMIGRADECQLRPKSEYVSRRHALIEMEDSKALIRDLGSRTGTFVNGHLIPPKRSVELVNGDTVKIGPIEFGVVTKYSVSGKKRPKVESIEEAASRSAGTATGEDVDVTQWLQPTDNDIVLSETLDGDALGPIMSAADLLGGADTTAKKEESPETSPDKAASSMLRNYLRRR